MNKKLLGVLILLLYISVNVNARTSHIDKEAWDVVHIVGSSTLSLALNRVIGLEWDTAAIITLTAGYLWECCDEYCHSHRIKSDFFDYYAGFDRADFYRDMLGVALSLPFNREGLQISYAGKKLKIQIKF